MGNDKDARALVDELAAARSESVRLRLRELEAEITAGRAALRELETRRDLLSSPFVTKRLSRLRAALKGKPVDIWATNKAIKEAVDRIVLNPERGELALVWRHAPASPRTGQLLFAAQSRISNCVNSDHGNVIVRCGCNKTPLAVQDISRRDGSRRRAADSAPRASRDIPPRACDVADARGLGRRG